MSEAPPTILLSYGYRASTCGYCSPPGVRSQTETSVTVGAPALQLSCEMYQKMVDRGWRRSGTYNYQPRMIETCCPQYPIRLDAHKFEPTRNQRKALYRFNRFVVSGDSTEDSNTMDTTAAPIVSDAEKKGKNGASSVKSKPRKQVFSLVEAIHASEASSISPSSPPPLHKFEVTIEPASYTEEKFELYKDYQHHVHKEEEKKPSSFDRFLCDTCLVPQNIPYTNTPGPGLPTQYGTHHQLYRIDGELVAMSVLDILPNCVSGVYFMYSSKWEHCQLGKLSVLREAALAREIHAAGLDSMKWVYLGFYIHSCQKMRYKGDYAPSYLLDPESYEWYPLETCKPLLDKHRYVCFSNPSHSCDETKKPALIKRKQSELTDVMYCQVRNRTLVAIPMSQISAEVWKRYSDDLLYTLDALGPHISREVFFKF